MKGQFTCSNCDRVFVLGELAEPISAKGHFCKKCWSEVGGKVNREIQQELEDKAEEEYRKRKRNKPRKFIEEVYEIKKEENEK